MGILIYILVTAFGHFSFADDSLFYQSVAKTAPTPEDSLIVFETETSYITSAFINSLDSASHYFVQLHAEQKTLENLPEGAQILHQVNYQYAIVRIENQEALHQLADEIHERIDFCGGIQQLSTQLPIELDKKEAPLPVHRASKSEEFAALIERISQDEIVATVLELQSWKTRYHQDSDGKNTGEQILKLYQELLPADRSDVELSLVTHPTTPQKSVLVRIMGQTNPSEVYILGSHLDSINSRNHKDAPGADDNASGTATNLEIFRQLMENNVRFDKTLEIHAYAAEEIGLVGSKDMAENYRAERVDVQAMVQFDMNGYAQGQAQVHFVSNGTNAALTNSLGQLVDLYLHVPWKTARLFFGSSDHASWGRQGYAVAFPTENPQAYNRKIHTSDDKLDNINSPEQMRLFSQLGLAFTLHYAGARLN